MLGQELQCRVGRDKSVGVALRLRWYLPGALEPTLELFAPEPKEVVAPGGWARVVVQTTGDDGLRLFDLAPAEPSIGGGRAELHHHGLYVRGAFRIVDKVNNTRDADELFDAPVDTPLTLDQALDLARRQPSRVTLTIKNTEPAPPEPWERRLRLKGAWLYVHPENERKAMRRLESD